LNANRQSDSFMSLEIAPRNSNHIPGGTPRLPVRVKREAAFLVLMSASASCGHGAANASAALCQDEDSCSAAK
jgi:hypothetical protein